MPDYDAADYSHVKSHLASYIRPARSKAPKDQDPHHAPNRNSRARASTEGPPGGGRSPPRAVHAYQRRRPSDGVRRAVGVPMSDWDSGGGAGGNWKLDGGEVRTWVHGQGGPDLLVSRATVRQHADGVGPRVLQPEEKPRSGKRANGGDGRRGEMTQHGKLSCTIAWQQRRGAPVLKKFGAFTV